MNTMHIPSHSPESGMSLIDTLVGSALMLVIFLGIAGVFQLSVNVVTNNRARAGAIALANERMEYLRSLSYTQIGVIGGIPAGNVPQEEAVILSDIGYTRRTMVLYSDDSSDGLGGADQNGITADYKTIRVEVVWPSRQGDRSVTLVGRVSPLGVETAVPGGTLTINVVNGSAVPVSDAQVDIINTGTAPAINIRTYTNAEGIISFIGAPSASNYQITVSRPGYSTAQTYPVSVENPNPDPRHLTVANNQTTSQALTIDLVSTKTVQTYTAVRTGTWSDGMSDTTKIATMSSTTVAGGVALLDGSPGAYLSPGSMQSVAVAPAYLYRWKTFTAATSTPAGTGITFRFYDEAGMTLVSELELPGNSTGFATSTVDLSGVSTTTYPALRVTSLLSSSDLDVTPSIGQYSFAYDYGPEPLPNFAFGMRGGKTIGNSPAVYKYDESHTSDALGAVTIQNVEADTYTLSVATSSGYYLAEACLPQPEELLPNSSQNTKLYVLPKTDHSLLVDVRSNAGALLVGASVSLTGTGYNVTLSTSPCGQVFFEDLASVTYSISVSKSGYQTYNNANVNVSGLSKLSVPLNPE